MTVQVTDLILYTSCLILTSYLFLVFRLLTPPSKSSPLEILCILEKFFQEILFYYCLTPLNWVETHWPLNLHEPNKLCFTLFVL